MANQITIDILANTRDLVNGVQGVNGQLQGLNNSVSKVSGAFKGLLATLGFTISFSWFKDVVKAAYDEEATFKRLADLYGEDTAAIVEEINALSSKFKVDDGEIAQFFVRLKSSFSSQFDKFVPTVVEASNTLALLTGKPVETVIGLWERALKDGKLTAAEVQKLGIDLTKEQEDQFNKLKTTAERLQFVLDIINGKQQEALDNITGWQKLTFYVGEFKDEIGERLIPVIERLIKWYEDLSPGQKELIKDLATIVVAIGGIVTIFGPFLFGLSQLVIIFKELRIAAGLLAAAQWLVNAAFSPYLVVILAVVAAGYLLYKNWDSVKEMAGKLWDKIKQFFGWLKENWPLVLAILTGPIGLAILAITKNWDKIKDGASEVFNKLKSLFRGWINDFKNFGSDLIEGLVNGIKAMAMAPINAVKGIANGVKNIWQTITGTKSPSKVFTQYGEWLMEGLSNGIDNSKKLAVASLKDVNASLQMSSISNKRSPAAAGMNITINAGLGTDPYELGRAVRAALNKYDGVNGR
ncbi:MAG: hypothetical protein EBR38_08385 [Flavobacteriaceae bacterium]|nr:hypothetical protein [Flavobacteriaceae bacterium]